MGLLPETAVASTRVLCNPVVVGKLQLPSSTTCTRENLIFAFCCHGTQVCPHCGEVCLPEGCRWRSWSHQLPCPQGWPTWLVAQENWRRHCQGNCRLEGPQGDCAAEDPEQASHLLRRPLCCCPGHQGLEGAPKGQEEGEEHPAQRQHLNGCHHRCCSCDGSPLHGQGVLRDDEGGAWNRSVCWLHRGRN